MSHSDDPFLVTSPLGIRSILRTLVVQKTLIHMRLERHGQAIITTLLHVDDAHDHLIIDAAADATFNQRIAQAPRLHFEAQVDQIRIQFHTNAAIPCVFEQRDAFQLPYPDALRRIQRRDHFRIDIPVSAPLFCTIPQKKDPDLVLPVKDISAGGIALLDREERMTQSEGSVLRQCVLDLDHVGPVTINLRIRRIEDRILGDDKATRVVACEFEALDRSDGIKIQNYIGRLERMLNARRRGFD